MFYFISSCRPVCFVVDACHLYTKVGVHVVHTGIGVLALFMPPAGLCGCRLVCSCCLWNFVSSLKDTTPGACSVVLGSCDT